MSNLVRNGVPGSSGREFQKRQSEPRSILSEIPWNWLGLAAAIILAAIIGLNVVPRLQRPEADQFLATQLIASHVRSLMANHLTDVASSDQPRFHRVLVGGTDVSEVVCHQRTHMTGDELCRQKLLGPRSL